MIKKITLITSILLATTANAFSADQTSLQNLDGTGLDWSGNYVGLHAGYIFGDTNFCGTNAGTTICTSPGGEFNAFAGGITFGRNWLLDNNIVAGIEADFSMGNIVSDDNSNTNITCGTVNCKTEIDWLATIRGRLGFTHENSLIYATGGYATADTSFRIDATQGGELGSERLNGYTVGAGFEHSFSHDISVKIEYLHTDLGTLDDFGVNCPVCFTDINFNSIKVGINKKL